MTRTIGGQTQWGVARWGQDTWANMNPLTTVIQRLLADPSTAAGVPLKTGSTLRLVVEMLSPIGAAAARWGVAHWGVDVWADTVGDWLDVSSRVRGLQWQQQVTQPAQKSDVGTGTVTLDNLDGLVSPWRTSGAFTSSGQSFIRAGLIVRWGVIDTATSVYKPFFTGKVDLTPESVSANVDSWVDLQLVELTVALGTVPEPEDVSSGRALSAVIGQVLVDSGWPYQLSYQAPDEDVNVCSALLQDTSANERLGLLTDGMHWDWCADGRGQVLVFRRHQGTLDATVTFANAPTGAQLPMASAQPYTDAQRVINRVTGSVVGGVQVSLDDSRSQARFGIVTNAYGFPHDGLVLETQDDVTALAERVLSLHAWDDKGIASLQLDADMSAALLPVMTDVACSARDQRPYNVVWTHPAGQVLTQVVSIEGQSHALTMQGTQVKWVATLQVGHYGAVSES